MTNLIYNKTKNLLLSTWYDYSYLIPNTILLPEHIEIALRNFWLEVVTNLEKDQHILIMLKIQTVDNEIRSISYLETVNISDLENLIIAFQEFWNLKNEEYHQLSIAKLILSYRIELTTGTKGETKIIKHKKVLMREVKPFKFSGFNLPTTMDITKWSGDIKFNEDYTSAIVSVINSPRKYHVKLFDKYQTVEIYAGDMLLLEFTDTLNEGYDLSSFTRKIKNQFYVFENGELVIKQLTRKVNFLTKLEKDTTLSNKFITMDLETRNINGILQPYCISFYCIDSDNIERAQTYYLSDFKSSDEMLKFALNALFTKNYDGYIVYLHNFSNFDAIFLIRILSGISPKINPIIRDGRIINIAVHYGLNSQNKIYFRDSYLMLTASLHDLANNFNIDFKKGLFPYRFVDIVDLKYKGKIPSINYFDNISQEQYDEYCSKRILWNLELETKYYCELDCKVLYLVIKSYSEFIFELFSLNIHKYPTLPSSTMGIFRSNFLSDDIKIPLIDGAMYNDLKKAYTGGMVDVYKPTNYSNNKVFSYDVNSLYPFSMDNFAMPVGTPKFFEGDILKINPNAFGIFEVEVIAPDNLKYPVLQHRVKTNNNGYKTISPLGNWTSWYFSEEIYNAMKFGYKFKVLRGYLFDKSYIFKDFVNTIYKLKESSKKGTPLYLISKLLLNSLYGKFGIEPEFDNHIIIDSNKLKDYQHKYNVTNVINLGNGKDLITYFSTSSKDKLPTSKNASISIALATTAYARIHMSQLKKVAQDLGLTIYYMDTDSIAVSGELPTEYVGTGLGKLKLEHVFNEVVYLAPKVYAGKTDTYEYSKVKGLKNKISFGELNSLLIKNSSLSLNQDKWYKNIGKGHITIKNEIYTLMLTENKRELIFDGNNIFIDTKPYTLNNGILSNKESKEN